MLSGLPRLSNAHLAYLMPALPALPADARLAYPCTVLFSCLPLPNPHLSAPAQPSPASSHSLHLARLGVAMSCEGQDERQYSKEGHCLLQGKIEPWVLFALERECGRLQRCLAPRAKDVEKRGFLLDLFDGVPLPASSVARTTRAPYCTLRRAATQVVHPSLLACYLTSFSLSTYIVER
jgi:hypothetical protein